VYWKDEEIPAEEKSDYEEDEDKKETKDAGDEEAPEVKIRSVFTSHQITGEIHIF